MAMLLQLYNVVISYGQLNFLGDRVLLPSNLTFEEWDVIVYTEEDASTVSFLRYGFPAGYEGPVLTPWSGNHPTATNHTRDVAAYISKELSEGVMLCPSTPLPSLHGVKPTLSSHAPRRTPSTTGS